MEQNLEQTGEIVMYQPDETIRLEVRMDNETVWLTQAQMVDLFQTTKQNVSLHVGNVFREGELDKEGTVKEYLTVQTIGNSSGYILPGRYNGVNGFFQINLNNQTGIIYHRTFYNFINRGQMYVNYGNERIYFF